MDGRLFRPMLTTFLSCPQLFRSTTRVGGTCKKDHRFVRHRSAIQMGVKIGTHDGVFHCDEALACYMLLKLDSFQDGEITRTRDPAVLEGMDCVVDVGAVYNPDKLRFDHHQRGFMETFDDKHETKLSSAGLVYKHFGRDILRTILGKEVSETDLGLIYLKVYKSFIEEVDAIDNGISQFDTKEAPRYERNSSLSQRVGRLNPSWREEKPDYDSNFRKAMALTGAEFEQAVKFASYEWLAGRSVVWDAFQKRFEVHPSGQVLVFDTYAPWKMHTYDIEREEGVQIQLVVYSDSSGKYRVQSMSVTPESFESRKPLPEPWRGLRDEELDKVCGIEGCIFAHSSGFIGGNKTKEGALKMAFTALTNEEAK